jgi:hypothetical protein
MPDRNRDLSILNDFTPEDYESAAEAAFGDGSIEGRLAPLVVYFRSLAGSFESLLARPELPDGLRNGLSRLLELRTLWAPPGFESASVGLARLVAESEAEDFAFGYRGTGQRERLIFTSEIGEIELDISPSSVGNQYVIRCQIEPDPPSERIAPGEAFLVPVAGVDHARHESFDETGFFSITTIAGVYDLTIVSGARAVRLAGVEIG